MNNMWILLLDVYFCATFWVSVKMALRNISETRHSIYDIMELEG